MFIGYLLKLSLFFFPPRIDNYISIFWIILWHAMRFFFSVFMYILLTFIMLNLFYNLCINIKPRILPVNFLCFIPQHSYTYSFFNSLTVNPWIYHAALAITKNIFSVESFFSFLYINVKLLSSFVQGILSSFCTSLQLYSFLNFTYKIGYFIGYIVQ